MTAQVVADSEGLGQRPEVFPGPFFKCGMNGSNQLAEMDSRPLWFCPADERKVWWACGADPATRYESVIDFAREHGLDEEAVFWRASLDRINSGR